LTTDFAPCEHPLVVLPVVLWARLLDSGDARGAIRAAARIVLPFLAVTVVMNAPLALTTGTRGGLALRSGWLFFFRFHDSRGVAGSLWALISDGHMGAPTANTDSAAVTADAPGTASTAWPASRRRLAMRPPIAPSPMKSSVAIRDAAWRRRPRSPRLYARSALRVYHLR